LRLHTFLIALVFTAILATAAAAGQARADNTRVGVMVLPFEMHAEGDISADRRNIMEAFASSLADAGARLAAMDEIRRRVEEGETTFSEGVTMELARGAGADFAVLGSITSLGGVLSVDWRVLDLESGEPVAFHSSSAASVADLMDRIRATAPETVEAMTTVLADKPVARAGVVDRILVTGNRRVDTEAILGKLTSAEGEPFSPDDVKEDIRAVYGMGYFNDITVALTDTASGKVLAYRLEEMPFVRSILIRGNDEVREDRINSATTMKENTVLDHSVLAENAERIRALYNKEGFYLAQVTPRVDSDGVDATVTFEIEEGPEVMVKRITFIGNEYFSDRKLRGLMNTKEAGFLTPFTEAGKFNELLFQNDLAIIMSKYYDEGFIQSDILDHRVLLSEDKKYFIITIALEEGDRFQVGELDVTGDILTSKEDLLEKLGLEKGEYFNRTRMSKGLEEITTLYGDDGYAYADVTPLTRVHPEAKTVDITLEIDKNEPVYIERIDITGNVRTRDKVIRRELEVEEGRLFSSSELKRSKNNLRRLGFFEDVQITRSRGGGPTLMKLDVEVKERPTGSVSVGVGYSSVDKVIGTASISQKNFMGTGIELDLSGTVSSSSSRYVLSITQPWLFDKPISAGFDIYNTGKEYPDFEIDKKGGSVRLGFPLKRRYTRMHLTYKLEDVNIFNVASTASTLIKDQEGNTTESSIKVLVRHDTRNDAFFPTEGEVVTASVEFAGGPIGGDSYFIKYEGEAVKFFPLPLDTSLSIKGTLGYLVGYDDHEVPVYERYFLGGINTLRGFETRTVGPRDPASGEVIGGKAMAVLNVEFLFPFASAQNIRGVVFYDTGNAYEKRLDLSNIRHGAGVGIRWFSPMGPLRLELGFNLDRRDGEKAQQWEFAVGTLF